MNPLIYKVSKDFKNVFNKIDINTYLVGSYASGTEREDSDINLHLFSEDYDFDKQSKLLKLFNMSQSKEVRQKLNIQFFDIKSLTSQTPSLSYIEHYARLYNGAYNAQNDFGIDPTLIRRPDPKLSDLCNQISLQKGWLNTFQQMKKEDLNFLSFTEKHPVKVVKNILMSIFVTKSSSYDLPHDFTTLLEHIEKYSIGIKEICLKLIESKEKDDAQTLINHFKSMYITSIISDYGKENFPAKENLEPYHIIHSSDRHILFYPYPDMERTGELETTIHNFYEFTHKRFITNLNLLDENFKTL
jgi:hypothetical protein